MIEASALRYLSYFRLLAISNAHLILYGRLNTLDYILWKMRFTESISINISSITSFIKFLKSLFKLNNTHALCVNLLWLKYISDINVSSASEDFFLLYRHTFRITY